MENEKEIRWLLKDKYAWDDPKIEKHLNSNSLTFNNYPKIEEDINRISKGEPVAYVIGWVEFLDCKIKVNENVLIPRPETEYWVSKLVKCLKGLKFKELKVLDLCCGSGCIGIALLKHISTPGVELSFVDVSEKALDQTKVNLEENEIDRTRYKLIKSDLFEELEVEDYDLIITNPPYVSEKETNPDLKYEPKESLYAGEDGLDFIRKIIAKAPNYLKKDDPKRDSPQLRSSLYLEFGKGQKSKIKELLKKSEFKSFSFHKDQYDVSRYFEAKI